MWLAGKGVTVTVRVRPLSLCTPLFVSSNRSIMDKQLFDMFQTRFDKIDTRFDVLHTSAKEHLHLLQCIDKKVAVNATHITWLKWSLRGVWAAVAGFGGWMGVK